MTGMSAAASAGTAARLDAAIAAIDDAAALCLEPVHWTAAPLVSAWSVGQHLEHLARSDRAIAAAVEATLDGSHPQVEAGGRPSWTGRLVLATGFIPRGRGRAPALTTPAAATPAEVAGMLDEARRRLASLAPRLGAVERCRATVPHPALGRFRPTEWLRFVAVHHRHHGKIILAIRRAAAAPGRA
jgi:uncharacterized damage-inducible protein DinB